MTSQFVNRLRKVEIARPSRESVTVRRVIIGKDRQVLEVIERSVTGACA